ncbi:MAG TPA: hypothetical protein EYP09_10850 [Anaerolineae bacterium]|nr:hypothetical protein [Anaerolineae bacterium]
MVRADLAFKEEWNSILGEVLFDQSFQCGIPADDRFVAGKPTSDLDIEIIEALQSETEQRGVRRELL